MRANFVHPPFARKLSDVGRWRGTLYADLQLTVLSMRLRRDLQPLALEHVSGRISAHEELGEMPVDGNPTIGANGHALTLTDFSLKTADGLSLPRTIISESYLPVRGTQPEKYSLQAKQLDLQRPWPTLPSGCR